jgi:hypothetical protein
MSKSKILFLCIYLTALSILNIAIVWRIYLYMKFIQLGVIGYYTPLYILFLIAIILFLIDIYIFIKIPKEK